MVRIKGNHDCEVFSAVPSNPECSIRLTQLLYNLPPKAGIHAQNLSHFKNPSMGGSLSGEFSVPPHCGRFYSFNTCLLSIYSMPSPLTYTENRAVYKVGKNILHVHTPLFTQSPSSWAGEKNDDLPTPDSTTPPRSTRWYGRHCLWPFFAPQFLKLLRTALFLELKLIFSNPYSQNKSLCVLAVFQWILCIYF